MYSLPFANSLTKCALLRNEWNKCQEYREREIFEEMR